MMNKIFGIGFHRTGTTSLRDALRLLGYTCGRHSPYLYPELQQNVFTSTFKVVQRYDAFQDFPWFLIYHELDQEFPYSKFILTTRNSESWFNSITRLAMVNQTSLGNLFMGKAEVVQMETKGLTLKDSKHTIKML